MTVHHLKSWESQFEAIKSGKKLFDLRRTDRPFKVGDTVKLFEVKNGGGDYTGRQTERTISYITSDALACALSSEGLKTGFCILGYGPPKTNFRGDVA